MVCALWPCICDKDLPKFMMLDHFCKFLNPMIIQFIKYIIHQEYGFETLFFLDNIELSKFQGDQKGFLLALRPEFF